MKGSWFKVNLESAVVDRVKRRLEQMEPEVKKAVGDELAFGCLQIEAEAKKSIQAHASRGREYTRGNVTHVASKPGKPPNTDTGQLVKSIGSEVDRENLVGRVGTSLEYGAHLEFGTSDMAARPWLVPAFKKHIKAIAKRIDDAFQRGVKKAA